MLGFIQSDFRIKDKDQVNLHRFPFHSFAFATTLRSACIVSTRFPEILPKEVLFYN